MRYYLGVYYKSDESILFDLPLSFHPVEEGLNETTNERYWIAEGASIGEGVKYAVSMCNRLVDRGVMSAEYRIEIKRM